MPLTQSCMHWRAFLGKLYKEERRGDGLAQAVGSGPGPGTPATCKYFFLCLFGFFLPFTPLQPRQSRWWFSSVVFVFTFFAIFWLGGEGLSEHLFASVNGNVSVCTCGPKLSFTNELCRSLNFCSKLSLSVPCLWSGHCVLKPQDVWDQACVSYQEVLWYWPCSYFGEYWCQHLLCNKEPDYANRTTGHSTVENLAPGVIQQIDSAVWHW